MNTATINSNNHPNNQVYLKWSKTPNFEAWKTAQGNRNTPVSKPLASTKIPIRAAQTKKKDKFKANLFEFLMDLFSTLIKALDFVFDGLGNALSKTVSAFSKLNPFK